MKPALVSVIGLMMTVAACSSSSRDADSGPATDVAAGNDAQRNDAPLTDAPLTDTPSSDTPWTDATLADVAQDGSTSRDAGRRMDAAIDAPILQPIQQSIIFSMPVDAATDHPISSAQIAAEIPMVILARGQLGSVPGLRDAGVAGPYVQYLILNEINGPEGLDQSGMMHSNCSASQRAYRPLQNNVTMDPGAFCTIHESIAGDAGFDHDLDPSTADVTPTESWFLHDMQGHRACRTLDGRPEIACRPNPGNQHFREYFVARVMRELVGTAGHAAGGMDGIYLDNVSMSLGSQSFMEYPSDSDDAGAPDGGPPSRYARDVHELVRQIHVRMHTLTGTHPLFGNMINDHFDTGREWDWFLDVLEGAMDEYFVLDWGQGPWSRDVIERHLVQTAHWIDQGRVVLDVGQGPPNGGTTLDAEARAQMDLLIASFLLVTDGHHGYVRFMSYLTGYQNYYAPPGLDRPLGAPLGPRTPTNAAGITTRAFQCGSVTVDEAHHTGTITHTATCVAAP